MMSRVTRVACFVLAICMTEGSSPMSAQDGNSFRVSRKAKVVVFSAAANVKELYVAIMGEVAKPGTYRVDPSLLNLHSIVEKAGGFTGDATLAIRVVRRGRVSHIENYSENTNSLLLPGDLLIVDSKQLNTTTSKVQEFVQEPTTIHASYEERAAATGVQIALLNVLDYPIVLRLRPEEATTINIIENLGQSPELLSNANILYPDAFPRTSTDQSKYAIRLVGGSAVVFDRGFVNRDRLPATLPKPIESDIALGAQSGLIGSPTGQSPVLTILGERMFAPNVDSNVFGSQVPQTTESKQSFSTDIGQPTEEQKSDLMLPTVTTKPRIATVPFSGVPRITNSSTGTAQADNSAGEPIPQPDDSVSENLSSSSTIAPSLSDDESMESPPSSISSLQMLFLLLVVGTLIGTAVILRRTMDSNSTARYPVPAIIPTIPASETQQGQRGGQIATKTHLELLIKNELPITFEPVEFPHELALQGRLVAKPILRVDEPQNVLKQNGPHFESSDQHSQGYSLQEVIAQLDAPETPSVRRPHFMGAEKQRVAASVKSSQDSVESPPSQFAKHSNAPLAKALFELEQGGRS